MSKVGRYSADRKKIEEVSESKSVTVADCGTIFMLASGSEDYTLTLPSVTDAGNGWWAKFVLKTTDASNTDNVIIAQNGEDTADIVNVTVGAFGDVTESTGDLPAQIAADGVSFDISACKAGDTCELFTNGTQWYGQAIASGSLAILKHDA